MAENKEVPSTGAFTEVYTADATPVQQKRWNSLLSGFEKHYDGRKADFVSRSPGRVNIIGEHIDYSLYECVPMAITADVLQAVAVSTPPSGTPAKVRIANVNSQKFPSREFEIPLEEEIPIDATSLEWSNYFRAGVKGANGLLRRKHGSGFRHVNMDILVDGTVPAGGGLSSSAAFVCASALAVMKANGEDNVDKKELVECAIVSERSVGVNSGGLDQSASVFALKDSGMLVSFKPTLSATNVAFPVSATPGQSLVFLIAQSLVAADKHVTAPVCYNLRVVECTLAALVLAKIFKLNKPLPEDASPLGQSLRGFHDTFFEQTESIEDNTKTDGPTFAEQLTKLVQLTEDYLTQEEGYTREQIGEILGMSVDEINQQFTTKVPVRAEQFKLRQRALHVFSEALRVQKFMEALRKCEAGDVDADQTIKELAGLINATQESCRDVYECSCPELDELCDIALRNGGFGSRLTGAGWGGCSVHLVSESKVEQIKKAWEHEYYGKRFPNMTAAQLEDAIVVTKPGRGSIIYSATDMSSV